MCVYYVYRLYTIHSAHWINVIYDFIYTEFIVLLAALINKLLWFVGSFNNKNDSIWWPIGYVSALSFNLFDKIFHQRAITITKRHNCSYILLSFRAGNELTNRFNLSKKSSSFSQNRLTNTTWRYSMNVIARIFVSEKCWCDVSQ